MSERLTWSSCPRCGQRAAVGLSDGRVVEADCYSECDLTEEHLKALQGVLAEFSVLQRVASR